jgi:hypothetical protein
MRGAARGAQARGVARGCRARRAGAGRGRGAERGGSRMHLGRPVFSGISGVSRSVAALRSSDGGGSGADAAGSGGASIQRIRSAPGSAPPAPLPGSSPPLPRVPPPALRLRRVGPAPDPGPRCLHPVPLRSPVLDHAVSWPSPGRLLACEIWFRGESSNQGQDSTTCYRYLSSLASAPIGTTGRARHRRSRKGPAGNGS